MSDLTEKAKRALSSGASGGVATRPADYDLRVAEALAMIAAAEALERISATLISMIDRGLVH